MSSTQPDHFQQSIALLGLSYIRQQLPCLPIIRLQFYLDELHILISTFGPIFYELFEYFLFDFIYLHLFISIPILKQDGLHNLEANIFINTRCQSIYAFHIILKQMALNRKKEEFLMRVRKDERNKLFNKIRLELLQSSQPANKTNFDSQAYGGELQIFQSIDHFRKTNSPLNFKAINYFLCNNQQKASEELKSQLIRVVFQHYINHTYALACIANILSNCQKCQTLAQFDLTSLTTKILQRYVNIEEQTMEGSETVIYLIYQIIKLSTNKQSLKQVLPHYYSTFIKSKGYFSLQTLLLLSQTCTHRSLLPSSKIIEAYLISDIPYGQVSQLGVYLISIILDSYIRFDQTAHLYQHYCTWIEKRLKQKNYPSIFKPDLINILSMILRSSSRNLFIEFIVQLPVFQQVFYMAKYGSIEGKSAALDCIATLVSFYNPRDYKGLQEQHQILQILIFSFELQLDSKILFNMINSLSLIFSQQPSLIQKGRRYRVQYITQKFLNNQYPENIIRSAELLQGILLNQPI